MSHKYQHIKTMDQLDEELLVSKVRRQVLLNEIGKNVDDIKENFTFSGILRSAVGRFFSIRSKVKSAEATDSIERILQIATSVGGIVALIRSFRGSKK